jgi:hypothetical protein
MYKATNKILKDRLSKKWTSPIYAFFGPTPDIEYVSGRRCHVFKCAGKGCKQRIRRFLDKGDAGSTSNLRKHAVSCWGEPSVKAVTDLTNLKDARESVQGIKETGSITASFERKGKEAITYSHRQHTKTETKYVIAIVDPSESGDQISIRAEIVRWVSESLRPFNIVKDRGFTTLMKTGRPEYYLPSPSTVSRDVRLVFANVRKRMAKMMQVREHRGAECREILIF